MVFARRGDGQPCKHACQIEAAVEAIAEFGQEARQMFRADRMIGAVDQILYVAQHGVDAVEDLPPAQVQRCPTHKIRNVTERLPKELATQVKSVMWAAYKLSEKAGKDKLKQQASWLTASHPDSAASLLERLDETFTVNRLGLTPQLVRCLVTTNLIENPNGAVRRTSGRVCRYRDAEMALCWTASGFLEAKKNFRRLQRHRELWVLATALGRSVKGTAHANSKAA